MPIRPRPTESDNTRTMNKTRNGKIARLPKHVRNQLNSRLEDGQEGKQLVQWLNDLPEVKTTLQCHFSGRPINEQNLSDWKQGGYQDWLRHQQSCVFTQQLTEQAEDLQAQTPGVALSDRFATLVAVELAHVTEALLNQSDDPRERWRSLREVLQELGQLRRDDHQAARLFMDRERWDRETERLDQQEERREEGELKRRACAPFWGALEARSLAEVFGCGEVGRRVAALITELHHDLEPGILGFPMPTPSGPPAPPPPDQAESSPIKPDQGPQPHAASKTLPPPK
jgi:hypothetical protein